MRLLLALRFLFFWPAVVGWAAVEPAKTSRAATSDELHLLNEALTKTAQEMSRWAYTEATLLKTEKGKVKQDRVVRRDPSLPYAEQEMPLKLSGAAPTEKQLKEYRERGEKRGRRAESNERLGRQNNRSQPTVGEVVDLSRATIVADQNQMFTFELPLRKIGNTRFPPEKFEVHVRVHKERRALVDAAVKLREPMRAKVVLKVSSGDMLVTFSVVDPRFAPTITDVTGDASASVLFVPVGGTLEVKRSDFKRVRPYNEKFDVQVGPMKALDF